MMTTASKRTVKSSLAFIVAVACCFLAPRFRASAKSNEMQTATPVTGAVSKLPADFFWGVSSSAFQSEGHLTGTNWNYYITRDNGSTPYGKPPVDKPPVAKPKDPYGNSVNFYDNFTSDIALASKLGVNVYRTSINWTRVEPEPGKFSEEGLRFYDRVLRTMRGHQMQPLITLNHWDYPLWVYKQGGWANPKTVDDFAALTTVLAKRYGQQVRLWITLNEPFFYILVEKGNYPLNDAQASAMEANLIAAHLKAYDIIHRYSPHAMVSSNYAWAGRGLITSLERDAFMNAVRQQLDYVALDYYYPAYDQLQALLQLSAGTPWNIPLDPFGIYAALRSMHRQFPNLPILIAENGMPTENGQPRADGVNRSQNLRDTMYWIQRARQDGVPVIGYMYWSLTDNYEMGSYTPRFGLYTVNILTDPELVRHPTDAVDTYKTLIHDRGVASTFLPSERPAASNCVTSSVAPEDRAICQAAAAGQF